MIILPKELSEELKEAKNKLAMFESLRDVDGNGEPVRELVTGTFLGHTFTREGSTTRMLFTFRVQQGTRSAWDVDRRIIYNPSYPVCDSIFKDQHGTKTEYFIGPGRKGDFVTSLCIFK